MKRLLGHNIDLNGFVEQLANYKNPASNTRSKGTGGQPFEYSGASRLHLHEAI